MRFPFIRTTQTAVSALKKRARSISKPAGGPPYQEALEMVAKTARYHSWHHVKWCGEQTKTFVGPLQPVFEPFVEAPASPGSDAFILLRVSDGPAGDLERESARRDGIRVSDDGKFLMFPQSVGDDDEPEALCEHYLSDSDL
jgi:hypothetical protein